MLAAEYVLLENIMDNADEAIIVRKNGEKHVIEKGIGCLSLWRYKDKKILIDSPGLFLGIGSYIILPETDQKCKIWNSEEIYQ